MCEGPRAENSEELKEREEDATGVGHRELELHCCPRQWEASGAFKAGQ